MKVRAVLTRPLMDLGSEEMLQTRIDEFESFYNSRDKENDLISYTVSPHGLYTCSDKCLEVSRKLAEKYNLEGSFPLVVILDKNGKVLGKMGFKNVSPEEYIKMIHAFEKK